MARPTDFCQWGDLKKQRIPRENDVFLGHSGMLAISLRAPSRPIRKFRYPGSCRVCTNAEKRWREERDKRARSSVNQLCVVNHMCDSLAPCGFTFHAGGLASVRFEEQRVSKSIVIGSEWFGTNVSGMDAAVKQGQRV